MEDGILGNSVNFSFDKEMEPEQKPVSNLGVSELNQSTMEKVRFVEEMESLKGQDQKYKSNLFKMMAMGFMDFQVCLATLKVHDNDFELACNSFLY